MRKEDLRDMALLVATIRTIFKLVRVMPFIYALSYIAAITVHAIGPAYASSAADTFFVIEADHMHVSAMMLIALISISTLAAINVFGRHHKKRAS